MDTVFDVAIIGGGINGCGCAADAALRKLSVVLFEQGDLASQTSSSSTKLIHGGLRYLENYEFGLVKKALEERQRLLKLAPHLVYPQSFVLPYQKHMRPAWLIRLGLFVYDHLSFKNKLPRCKSISRTTKNHYFNPLKASLDRGFLFYDAATDDARLTVANAMQASHYGASIRSYSKVINAVVINGLWQLTIEPQNGPPYSLKAKVLINAAGPWAQDVVKMTQKPDQQPLTLVKGSHIVVPKLYEGQHAYFLQHVDKRVVFVIPYHGHHMIGTTDVAFTDDPAHVTISQEEITYLCDLISSYFKIKLSPQDIIHTWSGVRTLLQKEGKELSALSRDYSYDVSLTPAPMLTVYGGKITTYRQLSEELINQLQPVFPSLPPSLSADTPLPGSVLEHLDFNHYVNFATKKYHWLNPDLLNRYLYSYGSNLELFLSQCHDIDSMGEDFGGSLYQAEVDYLVRVEWARLSEDILERRTKLGLAKDKVDTKKLNNYLELVTRGC